MPNKPIAIVGASCRFPGAANLEAFWSLLMAGRDAVTQVTEARFSTRFYGHPRASETGRSYVWSAGLLENVEFFDPAFFGISAREAVQMDPQQRLLLELAWEAIEDSGLTAKKLRGEAGGVYIGASGTEYANRRFGDPSSADAYFMTGNTLSIFSNRISYIFDLHGPSLTVDTACSSSLVALHLACEQLREDRIPFALVGGVNLLLSPFPFVGFSRANMLSKRGRCFSFDARGDGYVRGEGGGMVVLKTLEQAERDGDQIRGVILASGTNSDGRTVGLSLPNRDAQMSLLHQVYDAAGIAPDALSFIEAHGTGTAAGDPIEAGAIGSALGQRRTHSLPIGSVKTNIGHLEAASGMAGLIKAVLAIDRRVLPPSINFETPNPHIDFDRLNLRVADEPVLLRAKHRAAGVSGFGFGGTNAHIVLGQPPAAVRATDQHSAVPPLLLSARSEGALRALAGNWSELTRDLPDAEAAPLFRAAARARDHHGVRLSVPSGTVAEISTLLGDYAREIKSPGVIDDAAARPGSMAFVYSGNGAQWEGMARDALSLSPSFRAAITRVDALLVDALGWSVLDALSGTAPRELARTDVAQPLLFAIQVATTLALREVGVEPDAVLGHSVGEIAAAWASGALSLEQAAHVVVVRSRYQHMTAGSGKMAVLGTGVAEATTLIERQGLRLAIAAINAPNALTIAGPQVDLMRLSEQAQDRGWQFAMLDLDYAFHSPAMDPVRDELLKALEGLAPQAGYCRFVSTVEGGPLDGVALDAGYWWRNIREPVQFADAVKYLAENGTGQFLEIGPRPVLQSYIRDVLRAADRPARTLGTLARRPASEDPFPRFAASCYAAGYNLAASPLFDGAISPRRLPIYPWQRESFWIALTAEGTDFGKPIFDHALLGFRKSPGSVEWINLIDPVLFPWLADHKVDDSIVLPAAAIIEMALAAARHRFPDAAAIDVRDLEIRRALTLDPERPRETCFRLQGESGHFEVLSRPRLGDEAWAFHAAGRIAVTEALTQDPVSLTKTVRIIGADTLYRTASALGLNYGPAFQAVRQIEISEQGDAVARLDVGTAPEEFLLDPRLLDGAFQGILGVLSDGLGVEASGTILLPWRFDSVRLSQQSGSKPVAARIRINRATLRAASADLTLFDESGRVLAQLQGCWFRAAPVSRRGSVADRSFHMVTVPVPLEIQPHGVALALRPDDRGEVPEATLLADAMIASAGHRSLIALVPPGSAFTIDSLVESRMIAQDAAPLAAFLLNLLAAHDAAIEEDGVWQLPGDSGLPPPEAIWQSLFYSAPGLAAISALLIRAVEALPETLASGFGSTMMPAQLRQQLLLGEPFGDRIVEALAQAISGIAAGWPVERPLRILEIGAGTGTVARRLLPRLERLGISITYLATDPGDDPVAQLYEALARHQNAQVRRWNPAEPDDAAAPKPESVDIVISAYALTFGTVAGALERVVACLAPDGVMFAVEPSPNHIVEFLFGQQPNWWSGLTKSPLRDGATWVKFLTENGLHGARSSLVGTDPWSLTLLAGQAQTVASPLPLAEGSYAIAADADDPLYLALADALAARHVVVSLVPRSDAGRAIEHGSLVVLLPSNTLRPAAELLAEAALLARQVAAAHGKLWLVTRDAHAASPPNAAVLGLGRVIANEMPGIGCRRIDLAGKLDVTAEAAALVSEIAIRDGESEVIWTANGRTAARIRRGLPQPVCDGPDEIILSLSEPGFLDSLRWRRRVASVPGPGEVAIEVKAAGLNFRDVMWGMGLLPDEALLDGFAGATLGMECGGIVKAIGPGVDNVQVGDRVMAFAPASFASSVITRAECAARLADEISFEAAATIPVAFLTVLYSLVRLGRLQPGETILIHGGAGAVGLAAIQFAQHVGATVIATAGSPVKRAILRAIGVDHVLDSRSLRFADEVMELTRGEGVDMVLNSLGGEAMERSLGLLRPFGRFLELGKRDFYQNTRIGLRAVRHNISYFAIDADELVARHPAIARSLLEELQTLFASGDLQPLPYLSLPFSEVTEAFRLMRASGHIGKIVLTPDAAVVPEAELPQTLALRDDRTFVISGGLSGFGLATARWLIESGARHVALLSRSGSTAAGAASALAALRKAGAKTATAFTCDVSDEARLDRTLSEIRATMPPIGGVIHAAMILEDGLVASLDEAKFSSVLRPKLKGAELFDRLTRNDPIELFLLFSSATTLLGAPGQGGYVAANLALETLAARRRAEGLPALAVAWGPIADAGYLADHPAQRDALARRLGAVPMEAGPSLASLPAMLASGLASVALAEVNWGAGKSHLPILSEPLFAAVAGRADARGDGADIADLLAGKNPDEVKEIVLGLLLDEIAVILRVGKAKLDPNRPLSEIGMDSLMAVELRIAIERRLGVEIPALMLNESVTLVAMAARIAQSLGGQVEAEREISVVLQHETSNEADAAELANRMIRKRQPALGASE
jgi:acyl transferase domain-containing protein/NADPH:quinone reductase-like Zn-dependent oxidoreductase/acyl carrier protein/SAM-dependent methyltransferase